MAHGFSALLLIGFDENASQAPCNGDRSPRFVEEMLMPKWMKWTLIAAVLSLPVAGYAVTKYQARAHCPSTPDCPCEKK